MAKPAVRTAGPVTEGMGLAPPFFIVR